MIQLEDVLTRALRGWWLLALFVLLGGLAGLGFFKLRSTVYETGFTVLTSIDLTNTGEMSQFEEDMGMEAVGQMIGSSQLFERVASAALKEGIALDARQIFASASIERRMGTWRARLRDSDPVRGERIAAIWQSMALADLESAYQHALVADGMQRRQLSLEACLNQSAFNEPSTALCSPITLRGLQSQLRASTALIAEERAAAHGLSTGILIDMAPQPLIPTAPVVFLRGQMTAVGSLVGLVLGFWFVQSGLVGRGLWRKRG